MATWLVPLPPDSYFGGQLGQMISSAPKLGFIDVGDFPSGRMKWTDDQLGRNADQAAKATPVVSVRSQ